MSTGRRPERGEAGTRSRRDAPRRRSRLIARADGPRRGDDAAGAAAGGPRPDPAEIGRILRRLRAAITGFGVPAVEQVADDSGADPFLVLISTLLSARTQDATTEAASDRLFAAADTPAAMARLSVSRLERLIYPVSFYRTKARHVKATAAILRDRFGGRVPRTLPELVSLPGVGRKTANLVLILAHQSRDHICVDTHVHRISNRLGWVRTRTPEATEQALYRVVPRRWWPDVNLFLVTWGQNVCRPIGPRCAGCVLSDRCPRVGVATPDPARRGAGGRAAASPKAAASRGCRSADPARARRP